MMYEISRKDVFNNKEIEEAITAKTKNSNYIKTALIMTFSFSNVINRLLDRSTDFRTKLRKLEKEGLLGHDDYSIAVHE